MGRILRMLKWTRILLALMIAAQPAVLASAAGGETTAQSVASAGCDGCDEPCAGCEEETPCGGATECAMAFCVASPAFLASEYHVVTSSAEALQPPEPLACEAGGIPPLLLRPPIYA